MSTILDVSARIFVSGQRGALPCPTRRILHFPAYSPSHLSHSFHSFYAIHGFIMSIHFTARYLICIIDFIIMQNQAARFAAMHKPYCNFRRVLPIFRSIKTNRCFSFCHPLPNLFSAYLQPCDPVLSYGPTARASRKAGPARLFDIEHGPPRRKSRLRRNRRCTGQGRAGRTRQGGLPLC